MAILRSRRERGRGWLGAGEARPRGRRLPLGSLVVATIGLASLPATAAGHSFVEYKEGGAALSYLSAPGEAAGDINTLTVSVPRPGILRFEDPTISGDIQERGSVRCTPEPNGPNGEIRRLDCPSDGVVKLPIEVGTRDDTVTLRVTLVSDVQLGPDNDKFFGSTGNDLVEGQEGNDTMNGGAGDETIFGGTGNDSLIGEAGNDRLQGDAGVDSFDGGAGNDDLRARDGIGDRIACGDGSDGVTADSEDEVEAACETVNRGVFTGGGGDGGFTVDRTAPELVFGASSLQRARRTISVVAVSNEVGSVFASGSVSIRGVRGRRTLRSARGRIEVAGGGVELKLRLAGKAMRDVRRAVARRRRVVATITIRALDAAGNASRAGRIRVRLTR